MRDKEFPQKKVLSLVLCVAVMLSVMVMGAGAAFSDQDKIENTEASYCRYSPSNNPSE